MAVNLRAAYEFNNRRRTRRRIADKAYESLIETPQSLTGGIAPATSSALTLPAGGSLAVSYSVAVSAGQLQSNTETGRTLGTTALSADEIHQIGFFERDVDIDLEITAVVAGTATLHYINSLGIPKAIATAIFT